MRYLISKNILNGSYPKFIVKIIYASANGYIMCLQFITRQCLAFTVKIQDKYQSCQGDLFRAATLRVFNLFRKTKDCLLTYRKSYEFEMINYLTLTSINIGLVVGRLWDTLFTGLKTTTFSKVPRGHLLSLQP